MPSYRLLLTVGQIRTTAAAPDVLPAVAGVVAQHTTVEAKDIKISAGLPQLVIRFTGSDPQFARGLAEQCLVQIDEIIEITEYQVTARSGNRWLPL